MLHACSLTVSRSIKCKQIEKRRAQRLSFTGSCSELVGSMVRSECRHGYANSDWNLLRSSSDSVSYFQAALM
jgi:hypothetical protein